MEANRPTEIKSARKLKAVMAQHFSELKEAAQTGNKK